MEEENNILSNEDIVNLCFDFYLIGQSNHSFLDTEHIKEVIKNSIKSYIEFRKKNPIRS